MVKVSTQVATVGRLLKDGGVIYKDLSKGAKNFRVVNGRKVKVCPLSIFDNIIKAKFKAGRLKLITVGTAHSEYQLK